MEIAGIQRLTLVDFPKTVAATIFTRGCSFRCGFCHNPELVLPEKFEPLLSEKQVFDFLESRYGKLEGICLTGGEPTMQADCGQFISHLKALGFKVKLDTNGSFPDRLEKIIKDGDIDYIAMDIKNSLSKYAQTVISNSNPPTGGLISNLIPNLEPKITRSIDLIMNSGIDYEFRTTVMHPLHEIGDFSEIGQMIKGAKRYYLQNYKKTKQVDDKTKYGPLSDAELKVIKKIMTEFVEEIELR